MPWRARCYGVIPAHTSRCAPGRMPTVAAMFNFLTGALMTPLSLHRNELALLAFTAFLTVLALFGPDVSHLAHSTPHAHGHPFVDARVWAGIPNALDVLSNLPFLLFGAWGLFRLSRRSVGMPVPQRWAMTVFFVGLVVTFAGSSHYHWQPDTWGLMWDRLGMGVAFAGVLGLAVAERVSPRAAGATSFVTCVSAALAAWWCAATGDVLPWACIQFGGMLLVLVCAFLPKQAQAVGVNWLALIAFYALAKVVEGADVAVFTATAELVSGHSLKHLVASLAALPVLAVLRGAYHACPKVLSTNNKQPA